MRGFLLLVLALPAFARETPPIPPEWIETRAGTLPIILAAPHGGTLRPEALPDRTEGVLRSDVNTAELTESIATELHRRFGALPHVVLCRVHRIKVDCNRDLGEAAQGNPLAEALWRAYHENVDAARRKITSDRGAGLYLEIHGHSHLIPRIELGYLVDAADLARDDGVLDQRGSLARQSSVRDLDARSPDSFSGLLRGPRSLGALLEARGFPCVPSPANPSPGTSPYFSGSYGIATAGSGQAGTISAIQIETPRKTVRDDGENRDRLARALAEALEAYFLAHFGFSLAKP